MRFLEHLFHVDGAIRKAIQLLAHSTLISAKLSKIFYCLLFILSLCFSICHIISFYLYLESFQWSFPDHHHVWACNLQLSCLVLSIIPVSDLSFPEIVFQCHSTAFNRPYRFLDYFLFHCHCFNPIDKKLFQNSFSEGSY